MEGYPPGSEPDNSAQIDSNEQGHIEPRPRDTATKMSRARANNWGIEPVETGELAEPYTIYNHPGLAHYTSEQLETGDVESRDWELLRLLQGIGDHRE